MNPVALAVMLAIVAGFVGALFYAFSVGAAWIVAVLAIVLVGLFVHWG